MARERGYSVDIAGFEAALQAQRTQSQEERRSKKVGVEQDLLGVGEWIVGAAAATLEGIVDVAAGTRLAPSGKKTESTAAQGVAAGGKSRARFRAGGRSPATTHSTSTPMSSPSAISPMDALP